MKLTEIADMVAAQVPLCPLPLVLTQSRWAVKEFLSRSRAWIAELDGEWSDERPEVRLECPDGAEPVYLYHVKVGDRTLAHFDGDAAPWRSSKRVNPRGPSTWRFANGTLELWPYLEDSEGNGPLFKVKALAALSVDRRAMCVPDWLDIDDISYGALGKLLDMAGQTWSNPSLAAYFTEKFEEAIAAKRIERMHGGKPGTLTIKTPRVGGYF